MLECSQEKLPWAVNLHAALRYITSNHVCVHTCVYVESICIFLQERRQKIECPTESLIICVEGMGAGARQSIWHVHVHCTGIVWIFLLCVG